VLSVSMTFGQYKPEAQASGLLHHAEIITRRVIGNFI